MVQLARWLISSNSRESPASPDECITSNFHSDFVLYPFLSMTAIEILRRYIAELAEIQAQLDSVKATIAQLAKDAENV